jgi:hypothetical protein
LTIFEPYKKIQLNMKQVFLTLAMIGLFALAGVAQNHDGHNHGNKPTATEQTPKQDPIKLSENSHDFGKIPQGKPVTTNFIVENIGKDTLKIEQVQASCGCTTPEWSREPVTAGGKTTIKVGYNAASEGSFEKTITIFYNGGQTKQFTIKGIVWKTPDQSVPNNVALNVFQQQ